MAAVSTVQVEVKSITKAAVGLCYAAVAVDRGQRLFFDITVGQALSNTTCLVDEFDYDDFQKAVRQDKDMERHALEQLAKAARVGDVCTYNQYAWQVLASAFRRLSGRPMVEVFAEIVGDDADFTWQHVRDQPLGPNGLYLSQLAAERMGQRARRLLAGLPETPVGPDDGWWKEHGVFNRYVNGWWKTAQDDLVAIGYRHYYIVVTQEDRVYVQIIDDDYNVPDDAIDEQIRHFVRRVLGQSLTTEEWAVASQKLLRAAYTA